MLKTRGETTLERRLIDVYNQKGLGTFLKVCASMLDISDRIDIDKKKKANGAVCEVVLTVLTSHYLKTRGYRGKVFHSMILSDLDNPQGKFRTELDFTLLTPCFCLTGECKSLVGSITVTDECLLRRQDFQADVAKQSKLHGKVLRKYLVRSVLDPILCPAPPFGLFCFIYSNGELIDKRSVSNRNVIPVITIANLYSYYDNLFSRFRKKVLDYETLEKQFSALCSSEDLYREHREYLGY